MCRFSPGGRSRRSSSARASVRQRNISERALSQLGCRAVDLQQVPDKLLVRAAVEARGARLCPRDVHRVAAGGAAPVPADRAAA
ncbi:MAG TPA: hypothetical protein VNF47_22310 [Streptosporangiaceae bacterium]|nr:hypothetical protein [Streptosporangiaceae bacterium]